MGLALAGLLECYLNMMHMFIHTKISTKVPGTSREVSRCMALENGPKFFLKSDTQKQEKQTVVELQDKPNLINGVTQPEGRKEAFLPVRHTHLAFLSWPFPFALSNRTVFSTGK